MKCSIFSVVLFALLAVGCQIPMGGPNPYMIGGVDGPGPGVLPEYYQHMSLSGPEMMLPQGPLNAPPAFVPTSQINFIGAESLVIQYDARMPGMFDSAPLICPATHDFGQGNIYRLKLSVIPGHPGKELFPTLEIAPTGARTQAFLAHSSVPVEFNDNDFDQVFAGNYVTKVIYLPNPEFQGIAMSGVGTLVNTQLQPGVDPIAEASKRGSILAVIRMGNKDLTSRQQQPQFAGGPVYGGQAQMIGGAYYPNGPSSIPHTVVAGVSIPPYGVPMTKTTTGVPGPPQLPMDAGYGPNHSPILRTEPIPAAPNPRTYTQPGQPIPNPYAPVAIPPGFSP